MFPVAYQPSRMTLGYRTPTTGWRCHTQLYVSPSYRSRPPAAGRRGTCFPGKPSFAGQQPPQRRRRSCLAALPVFRATRLSGARHTRTGTRRRKAFTVGGCLGTRLPGMDRGGKRGNERGPSVSPLAHRTGGTASAAYGVFGKSSFDQGAASRWFLARPRARPIPESCTGVAENAARGRLGVASRTAGFRNTP